MKFLVFFLFSSQLLFAQNKYCFESKSKLLTAENKVRQLLHQNDKIFKSNQSLCFYIDAPPTRQTLYSKMIGVSSFDLKPVGVTCRLSFKTVTDTKEKVDKATLSKRSKLKSSSYKQKGNSTMSILTMTGKKTKIEVDEQEVNLICHKKGRRFEVELSVSKALSTYVQISPGQTVEIGSIVRDLKTKDKSHNTSPSASYQKRSATDNTKYYLSLE